MSLLLFKTQGSAVEPYDISIEKIGSGIYCSCTCAAGSKFQSCKHVMRILSGNSDDIVFGLENVQEAQSWLEGSIVEKILIDVALAEQEFVKAKAALTSGKRKLSKALYGKLS